jgi:hypothetical protein
LTFSLISAYNLHRREVKGVFLYSDNHNCRLDLRERNLPKAPFSRHPGVGTAFLFLGERRGENLC